MLKITKYKIGIILSLFFISSVTKAENIDLLSKAEKAIAQAKKESRYLVIYFYESERSYKRIARIIEKAKEKWGGKANFIEVEITDPKEKEVVRKCIVTRVPFTAVIAPNGAVTARFPGIAELETLEKGFVSPKMAELLKSAQKGSIVFFCLINEKTKYGREVLETAKEAVNKLDGIAELIDIDPKDERETSLLRRIDISPDIDIVTTLVIAPTGLIVERFTGKITERDLFDSFQKILAMDSGCKESTVTGGSACDPGAGVAGEPMR